MQILNNIIKILQNFDQDFDPDFNHDFDQGSIKDFNQDTIYLKKSKITVSVGGKLLKHVKLRGNGNSATHRLAQ